MAVYAYHRTSTRDQHLDRGIHEIQVFCKEHDLELENIFTISYEYRESGSRLHFPHSQFSLLHKPHYISALY